jgi:hypothetical protein
MAKGTSGFDTTGRVHYEGVKNEEFSKELKKSLGFASPSIYLLGGTKNKADAYDPELGIMWTDKHKKGVKNGSFDWINTSKVSEVVGDTFDAFIEQVKEYRHLPESQRSAISFVKQVRQQFNNLCSGVLDSFSAEQLVTFIQTQMIDANNKMMVSVNDSVAKIFYTYEANNHPAVRYIQEGYTPFLKGRAKSSRRLLFTDGVKEYDCGLRIRVTNNNGIGAFLGNSKANKNSQVVFKLQQDKIAKLLESVNAQATSY